MLYYYVHTGHRVGLDRLRRSAPVITALQAMDQPVVLLSSDFRAGEYAKEHFGVKKYVSVDVVRNIANVASPADALIFDSAEEHRGMWEDMADYFRTFIRVSDQEGDRITKETGLISSIEEGEGVLHADIVDPRYFQSFDHNRGMVYFWGDDDYEKELLAKARAFNGEDIDLLEGYYFFIQYGKELQETFKEVIDNESYDDALTGATRFLTSSIQSALEALAADSAPLLITKTALSKGWRRKLERLQIPIVERFETDEIVKKLSEIPVYNRKLLRKEAVIETASYIKDKLR